MKYYCLSLLQREQLKNRVHKKVQLNLNNTLLYDRDHILLSLLSCPLSVKNTRPIVFPSNQWLHTFLLKGNCCDIRAGVVPFLLFLLLPKKWTAQKRKNEVNCFLWHPRFSLLKKDQPLVLLAFPISYKNLAKNPQPFSLWKSPKTQCLKIT